LRKLTTISLLLVVASCTSKEKDFSYKTEIGSIAYQAQVEYFDRIIAIYSKISDTGYYYFHQDSILIEKISSLKQEFENSQAISITEQKEFLSYFEKTFNNSRFVNFKKLNELKNTPIKTLSDIDVLSLYIKSCFVSILNANKLLPFDTMGIMTSADNWHVKNGENFKVAINSTASNSQQPTEWFIVKDGNAGLTKDNIIDTLIPL
jgi:hypothetical protein